MARKTFQDLLVEQQGKTLVFAFGRFNPPTIGHEKLIEKVVQLAQRNRAEPRIYPSFSNDKKKNPLNPKDKVKFLKMMTKFPKIIQNDKTSNTPFVVLEKVAQEGFDTVVFVAGSDRVKEFQSKMAPFAKELGIKNFKVVSAGTRDPDAEGVEGMSASKMRAAAASGNLDLFKKGVSSRINDRFKKDLFDKVRKGMGLKKINETIQRENISHLLGLSFPKLQMDEVQRFSFDCFNGSLDNVAISEIRICDAEIDYDKASRIAQTANDAWLSNIFHVTEDGFLCGDVERFLAYKHRNESGVVKVRKIKANIRQFVEAIENDKKQEIEKFNSKFEEVIDEVV